MAFVTSLSSVEGLREIDFIDSALDAAPWLVPVLAQVAPLFVVIVNALLVVFLKLFSSFELPISGAVIEASLFKKLAWYVASFLDFGLNFCHGFSENRVSIDMSSLLSVGL